MFKELVEAARSYRRFDESEPITEGEMRELVDISRITPCGGNMQRLRYRIVSSPKECADVFPLTAWAGLLSDWPGPAEGERPTGYIAILSDHEAKTDSGIASSCIQFAACEMGYGACILGSIKREKLKDVLQIPDAYTVQLLVALGKPGETVILEEIHEGDDLGYYRDADDIHHVPKLALDDVLI